MNTLAVTDDDFADEVLGSDIPVLVDFWSPGCRPCRVMAPLVEQLALELEGRCKVVTANAMDAQQAAVTYGVVKVPSFLVIHAGRVAAQLSGIRTKEELLDAVAPVLG